MIRIAAVCTAAIGLMFVQPSLAQKGQPASAWQLQEQVRSVDIFVTPHYTAGERQRQRRVRVDSRYDTRLESDDPARIRSVHSEILASGADASPLLLMVLSARLYDIGDRDFAVFWHYAAKDRFQTMRHVLDGYDQGGMFSRAGEYVSAMVAFVQLAGPDINGYAFCNLDNQQAQRRAALEWVEAHPYAMLMNPSQPAKGADRAALLREAIANIRRDMEAETAYVTDPDNLENLEASRNESLAYQRYCW